MVHADFAQTLGPVVVLLGSAIIAVPLFGRHKLHGEPRPEPLVFPRK